MILPDYKRRELEEYSIAQLRAIAEKYELEPVGRPGDKNSWINAIAAFKQLAIREWEHGVQINQTTANPLIALDKALACAESAISTLPTPSVSQMALIRALLVHGEMPEGKEAQEIQRRMAEVFVARDRLQKAIYLLRGDSSVVEINLDAPPR